MMYSIDETTADAAMTKLQKTFGVNSVKRCKSVGPVTMFLVHRLDGKWYQATWEAGSGYVNVHTDLYKDTAEELLKVGSYELT